MHRFLWLLFSLLVVFGEAKLPEITPQDVTFKAKEVMKSHASHKKLTPMLAERMLTNYLDTLDPNKTYLIEPDIEIWVHPSDEMLNQVIKDFYNHNFQIFENIQSKLVEAIARRRVLEQQIDNAQLPEHVKASEFKEMPWAKNENELLDRLKRIRAMQIETASKLSDDMKDKSLMIIAKHKAKFEAEFLDSDPKDKERLLLSNVLKATASSLDTHTLYFTPGEANEFMIAVQHRLFGIGAQLRDDLNGVVIMKIVEGGPAANGKELKEKDRIIAVNDEPIVGMYLPDAVEMIRGEENTPVKLTIIREVISPEGEKQDQKLDVTVIRGEVVIKDSRYKVSYEPFGDGVIGYLNLYSFYQDENSSSAEDLKREIKKMKEEHNLLGVVLDLRYNTGGLLVQAVDVVGLFITKGIVVSVKDENGKVQHLRDLSGTVAWDGPLIVLVSKMSASASEIVAQTLQDYGRGLVVGDHHTFGKGSYQTFTLSTENEQINPEGEYKVTRGRYYTVSGKTPQLVGVASDITVPSLFAEADIGERFSKYPLENDQISENFEDDLSDVPFYKRDDIDKMYRFDLQQKLSCYSPFVEQLKNNSEYRVQLSTNYQNFITEIKKKDERDPEKGEKFGLNDIQLEETYSVMKDLIVMMREKGVTVFPAKGQ